MEPIQSVGDGCPMDGIFALENGLCQGTGQQYNYKEELHVLKDEIEGQGGVCAADRIHRRKKSCICQENLWSPQGMEAEREGGTL